MRVAIVTIISQNYGNRLQNFALQTILEKRNIFVETIPQESNFQRTVKLLIKLVLGIFIPKYRNSVYWYRFNQKIKWSQFTADTDGVGEVYDYFIAGSDQIWNPLFSLNFEREFISFASNEKKVAYAASIGINVLPPECKQSYYNNISTFKAVSVRESAAADIIENIGCCRPQVVLDPTMLLTASVWEQEIRHSRMKEKNKYVVSYFLGMKNKEHVRYIEYYAMKSNAIVLNILDPKYKIGPTEFVSLIHDAETVFTDSFHGTVFSILFHKPFITFERPSEDTTGNMSSRLDTLLQTFKLEKQRVMPSDDLGSISPLWDFESVDVILKYQRERSIKFLLDAIGM